MGNRPVGEGLTAGWEIGERVTFFRTVPWADHGYWGGPLTVGLYKELEKRLINPEFRPYPHVDSTTIT